MSSIDIHAVQVCKNAVYSDEWGEILTYSPVNKFRINTSEVYVTQYANHWNLHNAFDPGMYRISVL